MNYKKFFKLRELVVHENRKPIPTLILTIQDRNFKVWFKAIFREFKIKRVLCFAAADFPSISSNSHPLGIFFNLSPDLGVNIEACMAPVKNLLNKVLISDEFYLLRYFLISSYVSASTNST
jgi:hypothetical protein